jgi:CRP-like cAMP-binding protein/uncharacterized membrane protein YdbT with pleckstrin-like domain
MDISPHEIIKLLRREYLFQNLSDEQLVWIASQFTPEEYERDQEVYIQETSPDAFYMVFTGRVRKIHVRGGQTRLLNVLGRGEFFGEYSLLYDQPHWVTVRTVEKSILLRMPRSNFEQMLQAYPDLREILIATAQSRKLARSIRFEWVGADETVQFICRKHDIFLYAGLILPVMLGLIAIPLLAFGLAPFSRFASWSILASLFLIAVAIIWALWNILDWANDYYLVTNRRVVWVEKLIGLYESRREAPLDTILAVNVTSSQIGRWFGYGSVSVRTFTGGIVMERASAPYRFAAFVEGFKRRSMELSKEEEAKAMEIALEQALTRQAVEEQPPLPEVPAQPPPPPQAAQPERQRITFQEIMRNILKVRYQQGSVITYRKHWFILARKAWIPLLGLIVVFAASLLLISTINPFVPNPMLPYLMTATGAGFLIFLVWGVYEYVDWINDIYRLTPDQVMDIERKPLGQEVKKTAPLESILSIEHERDSLLGVILNFGTVVINVGQTQFIFIGVYNPAQVHADIADYREAMLRRKRQSEAARERERMINWLVTFHNQMEKMEDETTPP